MRDVCPSRIGAQSVATGKASRPDLIDFAILRRGSTEAQQARIRAFTLFARAYDQCRRHSRRQILFQRAPDDALRSR